MPDGVYKTEELSLWECLHDGEIKQVRSDLMARTLTVAVNSSFHWEFHNLPEETRFELVGENVRVAEVFSFEVWAGAGNPPQDAPWEEAEKQRKEDSEKGRLISTDWKHFTSQIETNEDCLILSASLETSSAKNVHSLGVMSYPNSDWRDVRIHAECFRFFVGARELSVQAFQEFGSKYWEDWSSKSRTQESPTEPTNRESELE